MQFVEKVGNGSKVFKNYIGVLAGDFDPVDSAHKIDYPCVVANSQLHTSGNNLHETHLMNLATLKVDRPSGSPGEHFSWWVKAEHLQLPFIKSKLLDGHNEGAAQASSKRGQRKSRNLKPASNTTAPAPPPRTTAGRAAKRKCLAREIRNLMS